MTTKIELKKVYGSYRVIKKLDTKTYGCKCVDCDKKVKLTKKEILSYLSCPCGEVEIETPPRKKKKKKDKETGTEVGFVVESNKDSEIDAYIDSLTGKLDELESVFGADAEAIQKLIESAEKDKGVAKFQVSMLKTLIGMIPIAESKYREAGAQSAAYALNAIISQVRELINDMQANEAQSDIANSICVKVIMPVFQAFAQSLIDTMLLLKSQVESSVKDGRHQRVNDAIDNAAREVARALEQRFVDVQQRMEKFFEE